MTGADQLEADVGRWNGSTGDSRSGFGRCISGDLPDDRPEAIYVLRCFQKKAQTTSQSDIELAQKRLKMVPR
jgi:hypothetical protein